MGTNHKTGITFFQYKLGKKTRFYTDLSLFQKKNKNW